jgi:molybdenum cofactor cytidylyltransferase
MAASKRVAAVVLAAGLSRRLGDDNKLLLDVGGEPMIRRVVDAVLGSAARPVVVVTGHEAARVREALSQRDVMFVHNQGYEEGLASSVRTGVAAVGDQADAAIMCLGDMPLVRSHHIDALIEAFERSVDGSICVPVFNGRPGNPVLWPARYFPELAQLSGDTGARAMLATHAASVRHVNVDDEGVTVDVDTREALNGLNRRRD